VAAPPQPPATAPAAGRTSSRKGIGGVLRRLRGT
jgi:hypothetical protein